MARRAGRTLGRPLAFWDTSALVPLCVRQSITPRAMTLYGAYGLVVWWSTSVEMASAFARLVRMNQLTPSDLARARQLATTLADAWSVILPSEALRSKAAQLVDRFDLRAADSLQLAAALVWCQDVPQGRVFLTTDQKLREAALLCGFDARQI